MSTKRLKKSSEILRVIATLACVSVALGLIGCSSSDVSTEGSDAVVPPPEAGTDAVPAPAPEQPQAAADPNAVPPPADGVPPADPNAVAAPPVADAGVSAPPVEAAPGTAAPLDQPTPTQASADGPTTYVTKAGDTLMQIAFETYGDLYKWRDIYEKNKEHIANPNHVPGGTTLTLDPPAQHVTIDRNGEQYLIRKGDTLGRISKKVYGTRSRWKEIWKNNPQLIHDPNKIYAGFTLYYMPEGSSPQPAPLAHQAEPVAPMDSAQAPAPANTQTDVREPATAQAGAAPAPAPMDSTYAPPPPAADAGTLPPPAAPATDLPPQ